MKITVAVKGDSPRAMLFDIDFCDKGENRNEFRDLERLWGMIED